MRLVDNCSLRNKRVEKMLRDLDSKVDTLTNANTLNKEAFIDVFMLTVELLIDAFKQIEDNTTPGKTLLEYSRAEIKDACLRVGEAKHFAEDSEFVMAVMQELGKK